MENTIALLVSKQPAHAGSFTYPVIRVLLQSGHTGTEYRQPVRMGHCAPT